MICHKCGFNNLKASHYCQDCGTSLLSKTNQKDEIHNALDDVIFVPQKKSHFFRNTIIFVFILFCVFILIAIITSNSSDTLDTVDSANENNISVDTPTVADLSIDDGSLDWFNGVMYYKGTLQNHSNKSVSNVIVRIDLYRDKNLTQLLDSRKVTIPGALSMGAYTFSEPVYASPTGQSWWIANIESADF